jgi:RNA polymerase sigma-70 factor (ECF subfamily)
VSGTSKDTELALIRSLRSGDAAAFGALVDGLHGPLLAFARTFTSSPALAQDIVQETWLGVIRGLRGFEGRSSLRTWIFSILVRRARTMAAREARRAEVSLEAAASGSAQPEWEPGAGRTGLWGRPLDPWAADDASGLLRSREALRVVREALERLPPAQARVVILRDVEDVPPQEICNILCISGTNLRVLLHRGRSRIRLALDAHLHGRAPCREAPPPASTAGADAPVAADGTSRKSERSP